MDNEGNRLEGGEQCPDIFPATGASGHRAAIPLAVLDEQICELGRMLVGGAASPTAVVQVAVPGLQRPNFLAIFQRPQAFFYGSKHCRPLIAPSTWHSAPANAGLETCNFINEYVITSLYYLTYSTACIPEEQLGSAKVALNAQAR
jgi:hypothetical protein